MRPDEHKKKKNAAYKKKHGIGAKSEKSENQIKQKKRDKNSKEVQQKEDSDVRQSKGATAQMKEKEPTGSSSSESEVDEPRPQRTTFQRRQIVSNWQKYEIQTQNEEQETRGESYEKLLSMSGDAVAHFRFKDEEEWDTVGALADTKINNDQFDQILNIDTQKIGQAMDCLPLYKVLGLTQEVFPNSELELMEKTAAENRQIYILEQPTPLLTSVLRSCSDKTVTMNTKYHEKDPVSSESSVTLNGRTQNNASTHLEGSSLSGESYPNPSSSSATDGIPSNTSSCDTCEKLSSQDEELDSLLDLDIPEARVTAGASFTRLNNTPESLGLSNISTPKGKNVSLTATRQGPRVSPSKPQRIDKPEKDGVDLEDWLDSILDD